ncbi:equilibrative nucleoside transporter 3-like isoform X2 [Anthonomus grandis grandis]|nr:equilibrative nucleoside transporter 3-like isoform X2 [Anthonomus grandis grandis]
MGVCHFIAMTFFSAANNFWLHKFRNLDDDTNSAENRTFLQQNFGSASMIANTIPVLALGIFNIVYGNKFKIINRIMLTFGIELVIFIFFTISTQVDTDDYQVAFFCSVMLFYAVISGAVTVNMVASMNLYTRFPHKYMKTAFIGEGCSGIVGSVLNVISIAIFNGQLIPATLMYFICGSLVVGATFVMTIIVSRNSTFRACIESVTESKKIPTMSQLKEALWKIRFAAYMMALTFLGTSATHTSVTSLVVSEVDSGTSSWAKNYFSPVMTFLLTDIALLFGRIVSSFLPLNIPDYVLLILATLRTLTVVPAIWFCNAQPRNHLPILFKHDYQYGIIITVSMFLMGYFLNTSFLHIATTIKDPNEADIAFTVFGLCVNTLQTITSPIGIFIVNIL